ncbi:hypothetical protein [Jiella sonneratiae]|uniref:Uncharacterized protein n=1 Tax=Jiella sonneratiae TaxID=2816856 RepID=A0ABS3IYV9_9HYPH|nr:hypothetical protein [Jiella sonneratiae]MBO0902592.1 hypothetical protein [Jiella sonneratiae]
MRDEPQIDPPVTAGERAESIAIARRHISACRAALIAAGLGKAPPRRRRRKAERDAPAGDAEPTPQDGERALAAIAQGLTHHCRRGDCRRAFACRFGGRGKDAAGAAPPCLMRLPQQAVLALRLGVMRIRAPEAFREPRLQALEAAAVRARRTATVAAEPSGAGREPGRPGGTRA